jgi:hypothetical protein
MSDREATSDVSFGHWVDFARGLVDPQGEERLAAVLAGAPAERQEMVEALRRFHHAAQMQREVPADSLARASRLFRCPLEGLLATAPVIPARLLSTPAPRVPVGVRSLSRPAEALYEAGRYWVDLRLSREPRRTVLVGQIADRTNPTRRVSDLMVLLMTGNDVTGRGVSNPHGEFEFECDPARPQHLLIPVPGGRLELPVPRPPRAEA